MKYFIAYLVVAVVFLVIDYFWLSYVMKDFFYDRVGHLMADEILGHEQQLLKPFRQKRYESGELHPVSNSPYPWS